ncbi:MAG: outer membrane protein assembly factor BamC [Halothiobacillaceae bacterium]
MAIRPNLTTLSVALLSTSLLAGCSYIPGLSKDEDARERRNTITPNLEVPPAFTAPDPRRQVVLPEVASARAQAEMAGESRDGLLSATADVRMEGPPEARYLVVEERPEDIWPRLESFLVSEGYRVRRLEPAIGVIETDWSGGTEGRPGSGGLMRYLRVAKDFLFKPDYLDRVRIRIEDGGSAEPTRVFVTTQRMDLEADAPLVPGDEESGYDWGSAHYSPEMDIEVMGRLAAYLSGSTEAESRALLDATFQPRAQVRYEDDDEVFIRSTQPFPRVWNRTRIGLQRLGFDPVSEDEAKGLLTVRHIEPQLLYEGIAIRGVRIDRDASMSAELTLDLEPQRDGGTALLIESMSVEGGELPRFESILLERLNQELR